MHKKSITNNRVLFFKKYWVYILLLFVAIPYFISVTSTTIENHQLATSGRVVNAVLTDKVWKSSSSRNSNGFYYSFLIKGINYTGHTFDKDKMPPDSIQVIYLPDKPNVNRPYDFIERNFLK